MDDDADEQRLGQRRHRRVVAFAEDVAVYAAAFHAGDGGRFAVPCFLPMGMFGAGGDVGTRACARFVGVVQSAVTRHLVVDGYAGAIDVVAEDVDVAVGAVVRVDGWVVADDDV